MKKMGKIMLDSVDTVNGWHTLSGVFAIRMANDLVEENRYLCIEDEATGEYFLIDYRQNKNNIKFI